MNCSTMYLWAASRAVKMTPVISTWSPTCSALMASSGMGTVNLWIMWLLLEKSDFSEKSDF